MANCGNCNDDEIIVLPAGKQGDQGIQGVAGNNGADGSNGATWFTGTTGPHVSIGNDGDFYLDSTTGAIYNKTSGTWGAAIITVTGVAGLAGADGSSFLTGAGVPGAGLGNNGDTYVNLGSSLLDLYTKSGGAWTATGLTLKGATGSAGSNGTNGANGTNGTNGTDGTKLIQGSGVPASGLGEDGDTYIDNANNNMYLKVTGSWTLTGNIGTGSIPAGQEHLFNAKSIVSQYLSDSDTATLEFSDDANSPHFDYGSNFITSTWTSPGALTGVKIGIVLNVELVTNGTGAPGTITARIRKNGGVIETLTGSLNTAGDIITLQGETSATTFAASDIVICELQAAAGATFQIKTLPGSIFYNV